MHRLSLFALMLCLSIPTSTAQNVAEGARGDIPLIQRADEARTYGAGPDGALDPTVPTIHEFADHACPLCRDVHFARADSLKEAFVATGRANLVVRAFPIPRLLRGPHAAEAALCAAAIGGRGAFEHFQRRLYEEQAEWRFLHDPTPIFAGYAREAGLDEEAFADCRARDAVAPLLFIDTRLGATLGATGTPTFVFTPAGSSEPVDLFYGNEPLERFEEGLRRAEGHPVRE